MKKIIVSLSVLSLFAACSTQNDVKVPLKSSEHTLIVDVRSTTEWNDGHKNCAVNFPIDELESHQDELQTYDTVYFVCQSGGRAESAASYMQSLNSKTVFINAGSWEDLPGK